MKFLSFKHNDRTSYGVKVKREDAVWDLTLVFADFAESDFHPKTLLAGLQQNQTFDFQEQVRKAVVAAEDSGKAEDYKISFNDIEFYLQLHHRITLLLSVVTMKTMRVN